MNKIILLLSTTALMLSINCITAQDEKIEIAGALQLAKSESPTPTAGTIQWSGEDFMGHDGQMWKSLTPRRRYITDIDNNRYDIITIGDQTWMTENLRVTRYNDGTAIPHVTDQTDWGTSISPAYCWYDNTASSYGALYNGYVVEEANPKNVCPTGWHVPSDSEWTTLALMLDPDINPNSSGRISQTAGGKVKRTGLNAWEAPNTGATNETGFGAVPGGGRGATSFFAIRMTCYLWSSSNINSSSAWYRIFGFEGAWMNRQSVGKYAGYSVRCLKDD